MAIPFQSFDTLVKNQVTAIQASSEQPLDFNTGTVELAMVQAQAAMGIWLEYIFNAVLAMARAQTSTGADLDTWMAQFKLYRLTGNPATGNCTFSRTVTTSTAQINVGVRVSTSDFSAEFIVIPDVTNPNYNTGAQAYILNVGVASSLVKVMCTANGTIGNVSANTISVFNSPVIGISAVTNALPFVNGKNGETDAEFRARFVLYINSLSRAVLPAYAFQMASIPEITRYNVVENETFGGSPQPGYVYTVIDDGTGAPPPDLLARAYAAIQTVRGLAILNDVFAPNTVSVNISVNLTISPLITQATVTQQVTDALVKYINFYPFNTVMPYSKFYELIYDASPGNIFNASSLLVNAATADLTGSPNTAYIVGTITIGYI